MIKNRTIQLIYQTVYCTLGLVGCVASLGIFDDIKLIRWDFYVYFTNISNFLCLGIMAAALVQTIRKITYIKNKANNKITSSPKICDTYLNRKCAIESVKNIINKVKLDKTFNIDFAIVLGLIKK